MRRLLLIFLITLVFRAFSQPVQFYSEKLDFNLTETEFSLNGLYFFRNNSADTIRKFMLYPFPQTPGLGDVSEITINSVYPAVQGSVLMKFHQQAASFRLIVYPSDTAVIHITYSQIVSDNKAEYILTSTNVWDRPLEWADYLLITPFDFHIDSLSWDADSLLYKDGKAIYKWRHINFMPNRNFFVSFSKIEKSKK